MSSIHVRPLRDDLAFGARVTGVTLAVLEDEQVRDRLSRVFDERGMILFEDVEPDLARDWAVSRGASRLEWEDAKHATRDAWTRLSDRVERAIPGDFDGDGR